MSIRRTRPQEISPVACVWAEWTSRLNIRNPQFLPYDGSRLLSHKNGNGVSVLVQASWSHQHAYFTDALQKLTVPTTDGQMDMSATFRFCTPYTLRFESTTPPLSLGFMAHVPSWHQEHQRILSPSDSELHAHRIPCGEYWQYLGSSRPIQSV